MKATSAQNQASTAAQDCLAISSPESAASSINDQRTVTIPLRDEHGNAYAETVTVKWHCPQCGRPRGEIGPGRRSWGFACDGWNNPCGHIDSYPAVKAEANANGLNAPKPAAKHSPQKPTQKQLELINQAGATLAFFSSALGMVRFSPNLARVNVLLTNLERIKETLQALRVETANRERA